MADDNDDDVGFGESSKIPSSSSSALTRICRKNSSKISRLSSSFPLDSLHETMLLEILIRLPCKSCFKFKVVSKLWRSLISESYYLRRLIYFNSRFNPNPCFHDKYDEPIVEKNLIGTRNFLPFTVMSESCEWLLTDPAFYSSGFSLSFLPGFDDGELFVVASWKDLLLCSSNKYLQTYYICNPLTRQFVRLPNAPRRVQHTRVGFIVDPLYHFNDDRETIELNYRFRYRVVRFLFPRRARCDKRVEIFDSDLGKWQSLAVDDPSLLSYNDSPSNAPILANCGMLHWWRASIVPSEVGLVSFDPSKKRLVRTTKPEDMERIIPWDRDNMVCLGSCQSRIRVYQLLRNAATLSIWELLDSESGIWQLLHMVSIGEMNLRYRLLAKQIKPEKPTLDPRYSQDVMEFSLRRIFFHPDDEDLVYVVFDTGFALYNIHTRTLTHVARIHSDQDFLLQPGLFPLQLQCWPTPNNNSRPKRHHCSG